MEPNQFKTLDLTDIASHGKIISIFTDALKISSVEKLPCAVNLFSQLFHRYSFDFNDLLRQWQLTQEQKKQFVTYLLHALYYYEIPLGALAGINNPKELEYFLYTMAAESLDKNKLNVILQSLSTSKQLQIAAYCTIQIKEGTWKIFNYLASMNEQDRAWTDFFKLLHTKYYNGHYLQKVIFETSSDSSIQVNTLHEKLEKHAALQIAEIHQLLPILINAIISSPLYFYDLLKTNPQFDKEQIYKDSRLAHEKLKMMFTPYCDESYSIEELTTFFRTFGLKGHILNNTLIKNPTASLALVTQFKNLIELFQKPWDIPEQENRQFILFVLSICQQLYSFHRSQPSPYAHGLQSMVFAVATRGLKFEELAWLPSILKSLDHMSEHLITRNVQLMNTMNPILIFDQANPKEFKKNSSYINALSQKHHVKIWHLSKNHILRLAKKLNIEPWIFTSPGPNFGYGGARNCVLLLAPLIAGAYQQGTSTLDELLKINKKKLFDIYNNAVLGKDEQDMFIHLGEDDVAIQPCNVFSDALFADSCNDLYFNRSIDCIGRNTHDLFAFLDLKNIIEMPSVTFSHWSNTLYRGNMKGMLTKPKFCLPCPLGNEELHVKLQNESFIHFLQPNMHLAGTRYPHKELPDSPLDGIIESIKQQLPYRFFLAMSAILTDPPNRHGRCIFPWNDASVKKTHRFQCLFELWHYASSKEIVDELKMRFWNNLEFVSQKDNSELMFRQLIDALTNVNFDVDAPIPMLEYYTSIQLESEMFIAFVKSLLEERAKGNPNFVEVAIALFEKKLGFKTDKTIFCSGFLSLVHAIEKFGEVSLV